MTDEIDYNENFVENIDVLEDQVENLVLDLINIAEVSFESQEEFEQVKAYLISEMRKSIIHVLARMKRKRIFDKDIEP